MPEEILQNSDRYGYDFIPPEFLPPGKDEYWQRNRQALAHLKTWRELTGAETALLVANGNTSPRWADVRVSDPFDPGLVQNSRFYGLVRIGRLEPLLLQHNDFCVPVGIRNSTLISCDVGDWCSIQDCAYISHYILGDRVILSRIDEMQATNHAKFGNGVVTEGESEAVRVWIDVMNEAGGRSILPFADMTTADAFLWAAWRDDAILLDRLKAITQRDYVTHRGVYGMVGSRSVIKSVRIIKDTLVGEKAYIKGANKLKNITIQSSEAEPTQIGEGVELVNGIIGYGCRAFYGAKAVRFMLGRNSSLKYGARLIHSVLGDNSTVSCCEMLNNLIFPAHEQHHNNSFLIASLVGGLSNMAAGATVGSNHNSRANDGELRAGRGFWPGLCVTLKHPSRFASYVLLSKGSFPSELDIPLPFSLVANNPAKDRLEILPAYYWMYNMYALERNTWKAASRDRRVARVQHIETDYLAPDTVSEILRAMALLESWCARARLRADGLDPAASPELELRATGRRLLTAEDDRLAAIEVLAEGVEHSDRPVVILKPRRAWHAYRHMLRYAAARALMAWAADNAGAAFPELIAPLASGALEAPWLNLGGQIVSEAQVDRLREAIRTARVDSWQAIHAEYDRFRLESHLEAARQAAAVLALLDGKALDRAGFLSALDAALETREWITEQIFAVRERDYRDPFKVITYRNRAEMEAVLGTVEANPFVRLSREELASFRATVGALKARFGGKQHG